MKVISRMIVAASALLIACAGFTTEPQRDGILWEVAGRAEIPPIVYDSLVVFTLEDGTVRALKRRNGERVWEHRLPFVVVTGELLRVDTIILIPAGDLVALDIRSGLELWRFAGDAHSMGVQPSVLSGDTVFVPGFIGGDAAAIDVRTGRRLWHARLGGTVFRPLVTDSIVVLPRREAPGLGGSLVAVDRLTGLERWRRPFNADGSRDEVLCGGTSIGDTAFVGTQKGTVLAYRVSSGAIVWRDTVTTGVAGARFQARPLLLGGNVLFFSEAGIIRAMEPKSGTQVWRSVLGGGGIIEELLECAPYICYAYGRAFIVNNVGKELWSLGGGVNGVVVSSNVAVDNDGVMFMGINRNNQGRLVSVRPPIRVGPTK
ncbi:MAG: PQQ-binding-like beta-propeller repeat protein [Gemmatimonadaceae bacterium]|nr:PQQ-binding-like beta-propeller repeat protein [Gemmatimonadaceae bacterium]